MTEHLVDTSALALALRAFSTERDWDQFHTPKNLAMALSVEAAELLEPFQWLTAQQSHEVAADPQCAQEVADELADVLIYLVRLADVLGIDLNETVTTKFAANAVKYPVERSRGSAAKYGDLERPSSPTQPPPEPPPARGRSLPSERGEGSLPGNGGASRSPSLGSDGRGG